MKNHQTTVLAASIPMLTLGASPQKTLGAFEVFILLPAAGSTTCELVSHVVGPLPN